MVLICLHNIRPVANLINFSNNGGKNMMAQIHGKDDKPTKLRITRIKEPIVWLTDDKASKPVGWRAGVGIAGLIPDLFKGYKHKYTRELISPYGKIVNTGVLSQAPGYLGTSTIVATFEYIYYTRVSVKPVETTEL
jgi:hypothetical protein